MENCKITKTTFKSMLTCPQRGKYAALGMPQDKNEQLEALAEQGYRIDALAKGMNHIDIDLKGVDTEKAVERTKKLLTSRERVVIAEAAFEWNGLLARTDILIKEGNVYTVKEVKSSSWKSGEPFTTKSDPKKVKALCLDNIYDVSFQTYVFSRALDQIMPESEDYEIRAFLVTPDPSRVVTEEDMTDIFAEHDVTYLVNDVIKGSTTEQKDLPGGAFVDFVKFCKDYLNGNMITPVGIHCADCPYKEAGGFHKCWKEMAGFSDDDFNKPSVLDLSIRGGAAANIWNNGHLLQEQVTDIDLSSMPGKVADGPLTPKERVWLQIGLATGREDILSKYPGVDGDIYVNRKGVDEFMSSLKFPVHLIDFETCTPAIPLFPGQAPYELVPFQFSHHVIEKQADGTYKIRHAGQYIDTEYSDPSFRFIRALKSQLDQDEGSILRYASHENTVLRAIRQKLLVSNEADKDALIAFIDDITEPSGAEKKSDKSLTAGKRNMIDLERVIKDNFIAKSMGSRTSIKVVLPAILNSSSFLQDKYRLPIYGSEIPSCNIPASAPISLISLNDDGMVKSPYKCLPATSAGMTINKGDLAASAYEIMLKSDPATAEEIKTSLYRYCELDTMSMVLLWEYFHTRCK